MGPGILTFDSQVFYSAGDIIATPTIDTFKIPTSMYGEVDERLNDVIWEITLTPAGQWSAGHIGVLWPYTNPTIGGSVFGSSDKNVVINSLAGQQMTFKAGAVTGMPDIILSAGKTPIGQLTMQCIGADNTAWSDSAKRAAVAAVAFSDTSFDPDDIKTVPISAAWGAVSPWDDISTQDGWVISFDMAFTDIRTDTDGLVDRRIANVGVMAKCIPVGISETQLLSLLKIQDTGIARGVSLSGNANDLVLDGGSGNPKVTINQASPKEGPFNWGQESNRTGEIGFVATMEFATGARQALFAVEVGS
jgi:hypothetical protein